MKRIAPDRLRTLERRRRLRHTRGGRLVLCCFERWPAKARATWTTACASGDAARQEDPVERYEGIRPHLRSPEIGLILVPPPPDEATLWPREDGA